MHTHKHAHTHSHVPLIPCWEGGEWVDITDIFSPGSPSQVTAVMRIWIEKGVSKKNDSWDGNVKYLNLKA